MKTLLTSAALAALLSVAPAFAEDPAPTEDQPAIQMQQDETQAPADQNAAPANDEAATPAPDAADTAATTPAEPGTLTFVDQQADNEWLASNLIGATVYNGADESLGDINDVVLADTGKVDAVVIGVGGFLGIGEKSVAIAFDQIQKSEDADGNAKFMLNATYEQLEQAPPFVTLAQLEQQKAASQPATDQMNPAPAPAPAN